MPRKPRPHRAGPAPAQRSGGGAPDAFAQAVALHVAGRLQEAEDAYRRILARAPDHAEALHGLGVIAYQTRRLPVAAEMLARAVALAPRAAPFRSNLGNALKALGRLDEAAGAYGEAIALDPADAVSLNNLGNLLKDQGKLEAAADCYRRALAVRPDNPVAHNNLGNVEAALGRSGAAERRYAQALALRPNYAEAHFNLANLRADQGDLDAAIADYRQALRLKPDHLQARINLGAVLRQSGRLSEAVTCYEAVLAEHPDNAEALSNFGRVLMAQGNVEAAGAAYERALALKPDYAQALVNLLLWTNYSDREPAWIFDVHKRWGDLAARGLPPPAPFDNDPAPERRLRVGYVSPDFRAHSVAWFLAPLLAAHDPAQVEIVAYAEVAQPDAWTGRFRSLAHQWVSTVGMSDETLAARIRADRIDILVDMAGHAGINRLGVFARRAAPVQVDWLGYLNTTGLAAMDYRLVDAITDPPGEADTFATETLVRLPGGWACYEPMADAPEPAPPPCLATGAVTFGSFSSPPKIGERVVDAWSRILNRTPASRLLLKGALFDDAGAQAHLLGRFAQRGVDADRISLIGWIPRTSDHLAAYNGVDIVLDPFPHNGVTTTCEALWMGAPVVALRGRVHCARISASFLTRVGLPELIAEDLDQYVEIAVRLAADPARLAELRRTLRPRMAASPLCDARGFARHVEAAYRTMWRRWCDTNPRPAES